MSAKGWRESCEVGGLVWSRIQQLPPDLRSIVGVLVREGLDRLTEAEELERRLSSEAERIRVLAMEMNRCGVTMYTDGKITITVPK